MTRLWPRQLTVLRVLRILGNQTFVSGPFLSLVILCERFFARPLLSFGAACIVWHTADAAARSLQHKDHHLLLPEGLPTHAPDREVKV